MVKRGPQLVQFVNAYSKRRFAGSRSSRKQSGHVATSGATSVKPPAPCSLVAIANE